MTTGARVLLTDKAYAVERDLPMPDDMETVIVAALRDERWEYRTVEGIAKETGLPEEGVRDFLESRREIVWKSSLPDKKGRDLYTLQNRHSQSKEFWRSLTTFMSKSSS